MTRTGHPESEVARQTVHLLALFSLDVPPRITVATAEQYDCESVKSNALNSLPAWCQGSLRSRLYTSIHFRTDWIYSATITKDNLPLADM